MHKDPPGRDAPADPSRQATTSALPVPPGGPAAAGAVAAVAVRSERADQQRRRDQRHNEGEHGMSGTDEGGGDDSAEQRGHNADEDRQYQPDVLSARYEEPGQPPDDQPDQEPGDDDGCREGHDLSLVMLLG